MLSKQNQLFPHRYVFLSLACFFLLSCGGGGGSNTEDNGETPKTSSASYRLVELDYDRDALISPVTGMVPGSTIQFNALGEDATGNRSNISGQVSWQSDNPDIVTVDASGKVSALAVGKVQITAVQRDGDTDVSVSQLVEVKDVTITIEPLAREPFLEGQKFRFTAYAVAADNSSFKLGDTFNWQSSNGSVVTIDADGQATILSAGSTTISISFYDLQSSYELVSYEPFTLQATVNGLNEVQLNWSGVGADTYTITKKSTVYASEATNSPLASDITGITTNSYIDSDLGLALRFAYQISARGITSNEVIIDLPSNSAAILTGDPIGKGVDFGNGSWQRKAVAYTVANIDPILEVKSIEVLSSPASSHVAYLLVHLYNKSNWGNSCMTQGENIELLDSAGNIAQGMQVLGSIIYLRGTKVRNWGGYTDTCFGPQESAYLVGYIFDDPIAGSGADFTLVDGVKIQTIFRRINSSVVAAAVIPQTYRVIPGASPDANQTLEVDVKNLGTAIVEAKSAWVTIFDDQDLPIYVASLDPPKDTNGLIGPGMQTTLSGQISFDGLASRIQVHVRITAPSAPAP